MKKYYKEISGSKEWFSGILLLGDKQVINPSHELLIENGWIEYITPPKTEPTEEELLEEARDEKLQEIVEYDKSTNVNEFYIGEISLWLDREERQTILRRCDAEEAKGIEIVVLRKNGMKFELPILVCRSMVLDVEFYASRCWDNTEEHKVNVASLQIINEIKDYNHTLGYPDKLRF